MPCIMPEQPYCPCCDFGLMLHSFEDSDEFCEWICLLTEEKYKAYMKEKENVQENQNPYVRTGTKDV